MFAISVQKSIDMKDGQDTELGSLSRCVVRERENNHNNSSNLQLLVPSVDKLEKTIIAPLVQSSGGWIVALLGFHTELVLKIDSVPTFELF